MSIIRVVHDKKNPYVILNKFSLWDTDLPLEAVGLWARLLSRPDDWRVNVTELSKSCSCHKNTIYKLLKVLISNGYCAKIQNEKIHGGFDKVEYHVFESKMSKDEIKIMFTLHTNARTVKCASVSQDATNTQPLPSTQEKVVCSSVGVPPNILEKEPVEEKKKKTCLEKESLQKQHNPQVCEVQEPTTTLEEQKLADDLANQEEIIFESMSLQTNLVKPCARGGVIKISLSDIMCRMLREKMDFSTKEIHYAWKCLTEMKAPIHSDPMPYLAGVIRKQRVMKKNDAYHKKNNNEELCKSTQKSQKQRNNEKNDSTMNEKQESNKKNLSLTKDRPNSSETGIEGHESLESLLRMKCPHYFVDSCQVKNGF